jgi:TIR domain
MSYTIFFSHSAKDKEWAAWIAQVIHPSGIQIYLFEHDRQPGVLISQKIKAAILKSDAITVLLTPNSQSSAYVQQEIGFAEAHGKLVIPLVWPGVPKSALAMLEGREFTEFDPTQPHIASSSLIHYLNQLRINKESAQAVVGFGALLLAALAFSGTK